MRRQSMSLIGGVLAALLIHPALAQERVEQPYIDEILKEMGEKVMAPDPTGSPTPYLDRLKKELGNRDSEDIQNYIDQLREEDPSLKQPQDQDEIIPEEKAKLKDKAPGSAIQEHLAGKDQLQMKRPGRIRFAGGFRLNATANRNYGGSAIQQPFREVFPETFFPDITIFGEYQPFHSEWFGNIGLVTSFTYTQQRGMGQFGVPNLPQAWTGGGTFGAESATRMTFITVPVSLGANYRFNLLRILRPYVQALGTSFFYFEKRSDGVDAKRGYSLGYSGSVGVNILVDWISRDSAWDLYAESGVKKFYLTLDYTKFGTVSGPITFDLSGISLGMTYEF